MWGIIPAAGVGSRIQPLAFSKELLPVGSRLDGNVERPRAVSEYIIERMILAGATKICLVISPGKSDILEYYGGNIGEVQICYTVQPHPAGLCDALFRALPLIAPEEGVLIGLPDTIWFPEEGLCSLPDEGLSFLLFPVDKPGFFDAVVTEGERVVEIQVKRPNPDSSWIWGAFKLTGAVFHGLHRLWRERDRRDEYIGTLVNAYIERGERVGAVRAGQSYVDVGTVHGYREAIKLLNGRTETGLFGLQEKKRRPDPSGARPRAA
ncbi:MAG TPA: sugar phosphate nucleotidyltransferase [Candidatus Manganitrophaceae bacterium]|nr:sugar phosphate nucleotidyltransferase [Candidatus Manganitrophaceae bacterium]